ncbi:hypothetical protein ACT3TS_18010 [Specibacter sp. AOP5-B1-6]|uniref:hypothetical protein n=1 Tax=Specibacter sp. AOP5-B1-6 TaxID=3457653 RepID=UPI00402B63C9
MEYVVPLLILLVVVIVVVVAARLVGRRNRVSQDPSHDDISDSGASAPAGTPRAKPKGFRRGREISREGAEEASARLTPESHQRVYSLIAQHQVLNAVQAYRKATRMGLGDSAAAVAALAQFPQPSPEGAMPAVRETPLTVEDIMQAAPEAGIAPEAGTAAADAQPQPAATPKTYRYRAIVSRGEDVREVASTRLNEDIFRHIRDLAQSGNYDGAARLLRDHADIGETDAQEFVSMIGPED